MDGTCLRHIALIILCVAAAIAPIRAAEETPRVTALDVETLRHKQELQQRARDLARELVSGILDLQLQQLEENGLDTLPLFRDIRQMRANIDGLIEAEMNEVVALLVRAQDEQATDREKSFVAARQKIRDIVVRLSVERQNLLRRLKTAELAAQVKRLLAVEGVVLDATTALTEQGGARQEATLLSAVQDQRDAKALYLRLLEVLQDVRGWGGEVGHGAAEGLMLLKAANTGESVDAAVQTMDAAQFTAARQHVTAVIRSLSVLLEKIEHTQGLVGADREAALEMVRALKERQEQLREKTRNETLDDPSIEQLVQQQAGIQKDLGRLASLVNDKPTATPFVEQATAAAYQASGMIFDSRRPDALAEQGKVLGNLAAIEEQLQSAAEQDRVDKSADEWKQLIAALEQAGKQAEQAKQQTHAAVTKHAAEQPDVDKHLDRAAEAVARPAQPENLPAMQVAQLDAVATAARDASAMVNDPEAAPESAKQAIEQARRAADQAAAEIATQLADARRRRLAVEAGELARASEVAERAVASARRLAEPITESDNKQVAAAREAEQQALGQVLGELAEGLRGQSPQVADQVEQARQQVAGPKPNAQAAVEPLAKSAAQLRQQVAARAGELDREARKQLEALAPVRAAVDAAAKEEGKSLTERMQRLAEADQKLAQAAVEQQRASGRQEAAAGLELMDQLADAGRQQREAARAAEDVAKGRTATPLEATLRQQRVAESLAKLLEGAPAKPDTSAKPDGAAKPEEGAKPDVPATEAESPLAEVRAAQQMAAAAARQTLDGNAHAAEESRHEAERHLNKAAEQAAKQAERAGKAPGGAFDMAAQRRVEQMAGEAKELTTQDAPLATKPIERAQSGSQRAGEHLEQGRPEDTIESQQQTAEAIEEARRQIAAARKKLASEQAEQMQSTSKQLAALAEQSGKVDAPAAASLEAAATAAKNAAEHPAPESQPNEAAEREIDRSHERASASLAARQQRLSQDMWLAQSMKNATSQQQDAAKMLDRLRQNAAQQKAAADAKQTPKQSAAQRRQQANAMESFAQAQTTIGQAAEDVSGQSEISNEALRKALQDAQGLSGDEPTMTADDADRQTSNQAAAPNAENGTSGQAKAAQPSANGAPAGNSPAAMGTKFIPQSPDVTAQQVAGATKAAAADEASAMAANNSGEGETADSSDGAQGTASSSTAASGQGENAEGTNSSGGNSQSGASAQAKPTGLSKDDRAAAARAFREEPWVAKLPPSLRDAIRAQSQRPAPRAYQERLRRYYESLE
ncbi:MAG: hypothetical protein JSS27_18225 [Planctomycetes bacterium]|nr:hypothetical protein [Planctomycetota bacterium]